METTYRQFFRRRLLQLAFLAVATTTVMTLAPVNTSAQDAACAN